LLLLLLNDSTCEYGARSIDNSQHSSLPDMSETKPKAKRSDTDFKAAEGQPLGSEIAITCFLLLPTNLSREMRLPFKFHSSQLTEHTKANLPEN